MNSEKKNTIKKVVDACMTIVLLCLMSYQVVGEVLHEWGGMVMTVLLIVHHILNVRWYASLFKGKYNAYRTISTVVNVLLLVSIALTAVCGMSMSGHAVPFLYGMLPVSFARRFHLAMSYWSFILMGIHLGLHLPAMTAGIKPGKTARTALTCVFTCIAGIGLWLFLKNGIPDYLFFRVPFAFFDYDKSAALVFAENLAELFFFAFAGANIVRIIRSSGSKKEGKTPLIPVLCLVLAVAIGAGMMLLGNNIKTDAGQTEPAPAVPENTENSAENVPAVPEVSGDDGTDVPDVPQKDLASVPDGFVLITGGSFLMGSPDTENWRVDDETQHNVTVGSFYMDPYETTQADYERLTGEKPSTFTGSDLPLENITWLDAVRYANARSAEAGLTPAYTLTADGVTWDRSADGYRLPTEAEWEYACRAGTLTPFNTEKSLSAAEANFYGHYPYEIEENYFNNSVLEARPGEYRQKTVAVGSFKANAWGLYDMHGNVNEWCWDIYGAYDTGNAEDPTGPVSGTRHVYRGGGWNDFAKNMRSAYRAAGQEDMHSYNLGVRLVRNADYSRSGAVTSSEKLTVAGKGGKMLIAYFSWSGNTRGIAKEIQSQTGADIFEITLVHPYSRDYNTVLMEAQEDQHRQARPEISEHIQNMDEYDMILLGYPNWWASIPMPIASFLEEYDFSGKTIIPFCSHGGGRFGQSITAIAKLAPNAAIGEGLSVHYSGGSSLSRDVESWLKANGLDLLLQ